MFVRIIMNTVLLTEDLKKAQLTCLLSLPFTAHMKNHKCHLKNMQALLSSALSL